MWTLLVGDIVCRRMNPSSSVSESFRPVDWHSLTSHWPEHWGGPLGACASERKYTGAWCGVGWEARHVTSKGPRAWDGRCSGWSWCIFELWPGVECWDNGGGHMQMVVHSEGRHRRYICRVIIEWFLEVTQTTCVDKLCNLHFWWKSRSTFCRSHLCNLHFSKKSRRLATLSSARQI